MENATPALTPISRLLIDESHFAVSPSLCRMLDLPAAVFLQQLNYRCYANYDYPGKWSVIEEKGRRWVCWSPEGLLEDVPLGKSLAAHKRIVANLKAKKIIHVAKLRKKYYDQSNFYSIDMTAFERFIKENSDGNLCCTRASIPPDGDDDDSQNDPDTNTSLSDTKSNDLPYKRDVSKERAELSALSNLRVSLESLIGFGPKDNTEWDKRRVASLINMVDKGLIGPNDLQSIIDDPNIRFLSQVEKIAKLKADKIACQQKEGELSRVRKIEEEQKQQEEENQITLNESCIKWLLQADQSLLEELINYAVGLPILSVSPKTRANVIETIQSRSLGKGPTMATIQKSLTDLGYV